MRLPRTLLFLARHELGRVGHTYRPVYPPRRGGPVDSFSIACIKKPPSTSTSDSALPIRRTWYLTRAISHFANRRLPCRHNSLTPILQRLGALLSPSSSLPLFFRAILSREIRDPSLLLPLQRRNTHAHVLIRVTGGNGDEQLAGFEYVAAQPDEQASVESHWGDTGITEKK